MNDHPSSADLDRFLRGELAPPAARRLVAHLIHGCGRCSSDLEAHAGALLPADFEAAGCGAALDEAREDWEAERGAIDPSLDAAYDAAFERAMAQVCRLDPAAAALLGAPDREVDGCAACAALLERCRFLRHENPVQLVALAAEAVAATERLSPERHGSQAVLELQARAWGELANAQRVAKHLAGAEAAMARAFDLCAIADRDELLAAYLFDLQASLLAERRRLDDALRLLDVVQEIYERRGDRHGAGRALISKGFFTGYANRPDEAIRLLAQGQEMIDEQREPQLALLAVHNTAMILAESGRFGEARALLERNRERYRHAGGRIDQLRLLGLSGMIAAGLGELLRAERDLVEAKGGFEAAGLGYRSAVAALDLAGVNLRQGRPAEARQLAEEAMRIFDGLGFDCEALSALVVLQRSCELGSAAVLISRIAQHMRRAEYDRTARFEPAE